MKRRLFVLTDIENEPDDTQSLIRLLLYSNEIEIEGLVACTSTWLRHKVGPNAIREIIEAYREVRGNLLRFSPEYPEADHLLSLVGEGPVRYGMTGVGKEYDSTGSELLIKAVDKEDKQGRTMHVALWGGANVLAQALWKVRETRSPEEVAKFISKVTVYGISDQDDAGPWIRRNFPRLPYTVSIHGENQYLGCSWIGFSGNNPNGLSGSTPETVTNDWLTTNIAYGPLGSHYPKVMFGMEGDTPSYLNCIPNGLGDPNHPDYGGWGGRYKLIYDPEALHYHDATDEVKAIDGTLIKSNQATIWRWRDVVQNDFKARMKWTMTDDSSSSTLQRPPVVIVNREKGMEFINKDLKCGETVELDASESHVPSVDGKSSSKEDLKFKWWIYKEIGSVLALPREVPDFDTHGTDTSPLLKITMPKTTVHEINWRKEHEHGRTYHLILEVTGSGDIPLTRYRRILLNVSP